MKSQILKIIEEYPKLYSKIIKKNAVMLEWVQQHSLVNSDQISEMIYSALFQESSTCKFGNTRKFAGFAKGYTGCGRTGSCQCASMQLSASVASSKKAVSQEQQQLINEKRKKTTLEKYGCENNGQTTVARENHRKVYQNDSSVSNIIGKIKATKLLRHGSENYNNQNSIKDTLQKRYAVTNSLLLTDAHSNPLLIELKCKTTLQRLYDTYTIDEIALRCGVHVNTVYRYLQAHGIKDKYKSSYEKELNNFLLEIAPNCTIVSNTRKLISKEIDIYLPEYNLAIEFNGIWWHHDKIPHIDKEYHYRKFIECEKKGVRLLTIFSNQWDEKKDVWKSKIKSMMHKVDLRVYARNCSVVKLQSKDVRTILDENHIQGYATSEICYGLKVNDKLVAAMTFSKARKGIGKMRGQGAYELVRYATACSVVGGASKLLSAFAKEYSPATVVSYSDNRYSSGELYRILGFTLESENKFNYWYYDPSLKKAFHRYKYAKHNLIKLGEDATKTEKEITDSMGLLRIWDCGTRTWVLSLT